MDVRGKLLQGRATLPAAGAVRENTDLLLPSVVVDEADRPIAPFVDFPRELMLGDAGPSARLFLVRGTRVRFLCGV